MTQNCDEYYEYLDWEQRQNAYAFNRVVHRNRRLKAKMDCGHVIDGGEPYRYQVWRVNSDPKGTISQRTDCEFCARVDNKEH